MTIDLERLAVDADYWNEVAPEGATHFMHTEKFVKWVFGVEWVFYASSGREWKKTHCNWMLKQYLNDGTFVLAKPAAQEWDGKGLPPVGTECEAQFIGPNFSEYWTKATVLCRDGKITVCRVDGGYHGLPSNRIRPIRSQAERERKELATFLEDYHLEMGSYWCPEKEADYILSSYDVAKKARGES
jgi:hypothetical protein